MCYKQPFLLHQQIPVTSPPLHSWHQSHSHHAHLQTHLLLHQHAHLGHHTRSVFHPFQLPSGLSPGVYKIPLSPLQSYLLEVHTPKQHLSLFSPIANLSTITRSLARFTSTTLSIHFPATKTPTPDTPSSHPTQKNLYHPSSCPIVLALPPL